MGSSAHGVLVRLRIWIELDFNGGLQYLSEINCLSKTQRTSHSTYWFESPFRSCDENNFVSTNIDFVFPCVLVILKASPQVGFLLLENFQVRNMWQNFGSPFEAQALHQELSSTKFGYLGLPSRLGNVPSNLNITSRHESRWSQYSPKSLSAISPVVTPRYWEGVCS